MNRTDATLDQIEVDSKEDDPTKQILRCVLDDLSIAEQEMAKHKTSWDKYQRMYKCILDAGKYPWRSKVYDPEAYSVVETICPRITNTLLGGAEIFGVKPTGGEDVQKAENTERLLNYQADRMELYLSGGAGFKTALIEGTGHWKFRWVKEFEPRYEETPDLIVAKDEAGNPLFDEVGMPQSELKINYKKTWECVYDNPKLDWADNRDLFVDPLATSVQSARFIIHRSYVTKDYLKKKQLEGVYKNVDKIAAISPVGGKTSTDEKQVDRGTITYSEKQLEDVEILERWGSYDIDGDGYLEETVITIANRNTVLNIDYNKLPGAGKPFLRFTPIPISGEYYGMSPLQSFETIQDALNDRTNQIGDAINLTINPMYKKNRWADISDDDLVSRPGGVIEMNSLQDLEALNPPMMQPNVFTEIARFESIIQKSSGTFDVARGAVAERQETATTTIALQNVAEIRFKTMAILAERQFIRPLGNLMIRYNKIYMTQPRQIRIIGNDFMLDPSTATAPQGQQMPGVPPQQGAQQIPGSLPPLMGGGEQFATISRDNLAEDPDIYAVGAALEIGVSKEMQLNNILKFLQISANPMFAQNPLFSINHAALIERMPYLMNLKLKQPVITKGNPMLAYQEIMQEKSLADGVMMGEIQGGMPPGTMTKPGGPPSRTKGELAKSDVPANDEQEV